MSKSDSILIGTLVSALALTVAGVGSLAISVSKKKDNEWQRVYEQGQSRITGTVLQEVYENTLSSVPERHIGGLVSQAYSNETIKLDSKYTLKLQTDDGKLIGLSIIDGARTKKEGLDILIQSAEEVGIENATRISFPIGNLYKSRRNGRLQGETYFTPETQFGNKRAGRIRIE